MANRLTEILRFLWREEKIKSEEMVAINNAVLYMKETVPPGFAAMDGLNMLTEESNSSETKRSKQDAK